jgi:DNA-binding CsgD family transcriptional regulator
MKGSDGFILPPPGTMELAVSAPSSSILSVLVLLCVMAVPGPKLATINAKTLCAFLRFWVWLLCLCWTFHSAGQMELRHLRNCYASLSARERQVMALVVSGLLNKQVGGELGISEITVKAHRRQAMQKMMANSLPDLVRMAAKLQLAPQQFTWPN